jgi:hypothetical protein
MSPFAQAQGGVPSRPRLLDYALILAGCSLSLLLADLSGWRAVAAGDASTPLLQAFLKIVPHMLFLPVGVLLFWPLFYATQKVLGRQQTLSAGEWLWGLAWLADLALTAWIAWQALGAPPEFLVAPGFRRGVLIGYVISVLALAVICVILALVGLVFRWQQPWTHSFGLMLMIWPVSPLAALWMQNVKLE